MKTLTTKAIIANSFISLAECIPYEKITIDSIAKNASVHRNTVYYYFPDKDSIFEYIFAKDKKRFLSYIETEDFDLINNDIFKSILNILLSRETFYSNIAKGSPDILRNALLNIFKMSFTQIVSYYTKTRTIPEEIKTSIICFHAMGSTETILKALKDGRMPKNNMIDSRILTFISVKSAIDSYFMIRQDL